MIMYCFCKKSSFITAGCRKRYEENGVVSCGSGTLDGPESHTSESSTVTNIVLTVREKFIILRFLLASFCIKHGKFLSKAHFLA